jgi:L-alanine-DL-glutamate epimerase-like enolase superfamily enzyme
MPIIQSLRIKPVTFRLHQPFVTAAGKKALTRNVQVIIQLSDGTEGWGEASSSIAMPEESQQNMERVLKTLIPEMREKDIADYRSLVQTAWRLQPYHPTAMAALECAILDAYTRTQGQALYQFFGGHKTTVESDLTLSVGTPQNLSKTVKAAMRKGFKKFKVKLAGDSPKKDVERVLAVHRAAPKALLVADGNQGMNASQAWEFIQGLEKALVKLSFQEQPFPKHDLPSMRTFRKKCRVPLMADESVLTPADAQRVFDSGAADGVVIKVAKSGIQGALDIIQIARRAGKKLAIGCMEESKLGLAASVHLACGTGAFDWIDLDSVFLLDEPPLRGGFRMSGPRLSVAGVRSGIGI